MQKLVWQNANGVELDLTSGNYGITEWEGFSNTSLNIQQQQVPFQDGGVFLDALIEQRELSVTLAMQDRNNLEERYRQRRELISALNPKLGEGYLIYTNDFISKRIKCVPQIPLFETHNSDTVGTPKASLSWTACEPYWEDLEETEVELSTETTTEINNAGDVDIGFEIAIIPKNNDSITVTSLTEEKQIVIEGTTALISNIGISTKNGEKKVESITPLLETFSMQYDTRHIAKGNGVWVISGQNGTYSSSDLENWSNINNINLTKIIWNKVLGLFVGIYGTNVYTSPDAVQWATISISGLLSSASDICYNEITGRIYIAGSKVIVSDNGTDFAESLDQVMGTCCYNRYTNEVMVANRADLCYVNKNGQWEQQPPVILSPSAQASSFKFCCVDDKGNYMLGDYWTGVVVVTSHFTTLGNYFAQGGYCCCYDQTEKTFICGGQIPFSSSYYLWVFRMEKGKLQTTTELKNMNMTQIQDMKIIDGAIYMAGVSVLYKKLGSNMIQYMTQNSDLGIKLTEGNNYFLLEYEGGNQPSALLKYRQKYIGV